MLPGKLFDDPNVTAQYHTMGRLHGKTNEPQETPQELMRCSFCRKSGSKVAKLYAGLREAYRCNRCLEVCEEILKDYVAHPQKKSKTPPAKLTRGPPCLKDSSQAERD